MLNTFKHIMTILCEKDSHAMGFSVFILDDDFLKLYSIDNFYLFKPEKNISIEILQEIGFSRSKTISTVVRNTLLQ